MVLVGVASEMHRRRVDPVVPLPGGLAGPGNIASNRQIISGCTDIGVDEDGPPLSSPRASCRRCRPEKSTVAFMFGSHT